MSRIPEGATHTYKGIGGGYRRRNADGKWAWWDENRWTVVKVPRPDLYQAIATQAIATQAWNGEGLPPVGTVCEVIGLGTGTLPRSLETWIDGDKVECIAHVAMQGAGHVSPVFFNKRAFGFSSLRADCFRPAEQIAAEEQDQAIKVMLAEFEHTGSLTSHYEVCKVLHKAGYRKFEIVEEDDNA